MSPVISRLDKLVEFRDPLGAAAKQFLPRLRSAYLTDGSTAAETLARDNPQFAFITPDGTCYQGRMVTGGRPDEAGPLGMKRELRALDAEVTQLEQHAERSRTVLEALTSDLRSAEQSLEEITVQQHAAERDVYSAKHRHEQTQADLARLGLELTVCQSELTHIRQAVETLVHARITRSISSPRPIPRAPKPKRKACALLKISFSFAAPSSRNRMSWRPRARNLPR